MGFILFKFGQEKNIIDLYENGTVYCNTLKYFRDLEDKQLRGDKYEGIKFIKNIHNQDLKYFHIQLKDKSKPPIQFQEPFLKHLHSKEYYPNYSLNTFCLISIFETEETAKGWYRFDTRVLEFGTHYLFMQNSQILYDRLEAELKRLKYTFWATHVNYYDKNEYNGELGFFDKVNEFEWQSEFRFLILNKESKPLIIKLGSLKDIAQLRQVDKLSNSIP